MDFSRIFRKGFTLALFLIMSAGIAAHAQVWNVPAATDTTIGDESSTIQGDSFTDWHWVDPNGNTRSFPGRTMDAMKYILHPDGSRSAGSPYVTSLVNVQASDGSSFYLNATGGVGIVTATAMVAPKYQIVSIIYAPPGSNGTAQKSLVDYSSSNLLGVTSSIDQTFSNNVKLTVTAGNKNLGPSGSVSLEWGESVNDSHSLSITKTQTNDVKWYGPIGDGINHDYDEILLWLNPKITGNIFSLTNVQWTFDNDEMDPATAMVGMDIVPVLIGQLKGTIPMNADLVNALARSWAGPNGGLTASDFATILARDPYWNLGNSTVTFVPDPVRFTPQGVGQIPYVPTAPGNTPYVWSNSFQYADTSIIGKTATDTFSMAISGAMNWGLAGISLTDTFTWTNKYTNQTTNTSSKIYSVSIQQPSSSWNGPIGLTVYKDNVYGGLLFVYVPH